MIDRKNDALRAGEAKIGSKHASNETPVEWCSRMINEASNPIDKGVYETLLKQWERK